VPIEVVTSNHERIKNMTSELITLQSDNLFDLDNELRRDPGIKSDRTRAGYRMDLQAFQAWRAGRVVTKSLVEDYAAELQAQGKAPNTINRKLAAIRWWVNRISDRAQDTPGIDPAALEAITRRAERIASIEGVRGSRPARGRHITSGELSALIAACQADTSPAGARDCALIGLAWCVGARRDELAGLELADFTPNGAEDGDLIIQGKGDKARSAYVYNGAFSALADWLAIRGGDPGAIFCVIGKGGKVQPDRRLSGEALRLILDKRIEQALVKPLTWNDFRRSFAGNLLESGADLVTVQKLMGHESPITTSKYDRRGDEVKRKAVRALFVPYKKRA
jgi:site-specific recombinase XerD